MPTDFAHLHVHTENSMLDGLDAPEAYVARAAAMGQKHLAITDHGNMCGVPSFYKACRDTGVNPILGEEFYFVPDAVASREEKDRERFHVTMMARNAKGFEVMCHLSTESHRRFYGKPLLDRALLEQLGEDAKYLTVLSGCAGSIISQKIMGEEQGEPAEELEWWTKIFPNFYLELMHHGTDFDRSLNRGLLRLGRKFGLPHVITNDPHFVMEDDCVNHDALLAIQTASDIDDPNRFRFQGSGYHLKSRKEMYAAFKDYEKNVWKTGVQHTLEVARSTDIRIPTWDKTSWHIPDFPDVEDSYAEVKRLCGRTMRRRGLTKDPRYVDQLAHELAAFKKVPKMSDFMLITRDIDEYMRRQGYMVGPGRGSVAGTLIGYLIGVHKVDPIRYDLMFERFLNPERPKMPDVDTDFAPNERPFAFQYVIGKYGADNVAPVAAFQTMKTKRAFQSLAAAHGMDFKKRMVFSNQIEEDEEGNAILPPELIKGYPDLITQMEKLTGAKGALSSHPAGVLIFSPDDEIRKTVPYMWIPAGKSKEKGKFVAQYDLAATELLYLMKQDLLGLRNLATIAYTVALVRERHGRSLNPDAWIPDEEPGDASVYKMIGSGDTDGVFQMEGKSNRAGIQRIGCKKFEDLVTCFPGGTEVAGPPPEGALRHWYDGDVVRLTFQSGNGLTVTPNHPLLRGEEWVPAGLLTVGDSLTTAGLGERMGRSDPDIEQAPTLIEQVFASLHNVGQGVRTTLGSVDLYGYRPTGQVDVVGADRKLRENFEPTLLQPAPNPVLAPADSGDIKLPAPSPSGKPLFREFSPSHGGVRSSRQGGSLLSRGLGHAEGGGLGAASQWDAASLQSASDHAATRPIPSGDLLHSHAREIVLDEIVGVDVVPHAGYVYTLKTGEGWYTANSVVAGNCTSLFRAGPIIAGAPKRYIRNREDERVRVIHPSLKEILAVSWGEMIYDEQMFRILNEAAGFSWSRVDDAKTAMKKKKIEMMAAIKPDAIKGFMETSGMSAEQAEQTWEMIAAQASYLFNRSHAVAYSLVTYQTAKLKHDFPQEYLAACIATVPGANDADKEKRQRYMSSAAARGFEILPPCVNKSEAYARPEGKKGIRLGFVDIKGVGDSAAKRLIDKRPDGGFTKKWQVVGATASNVRKALIQSGALECLGLQADPGLQEELLLWQFYDPLAEFRARWGPRRKVPKGDGPCLLVGEIRKTEKKKAKNGNFYYRWQCRWEPGSDFAVTIWSDANELWDLQVGSIVVVEGKWSSEWGNTSVGDHEMVRVLHAVRPSTS